MEWPLPNAPIKRFIKKFKTFTTHCQPLNEKKTTSRSSVLVLMLNAVSTDEQLAEESATENGEEIANVHGHDG